MERSFESEPVGLPNPNATRDGATGSGAPCDFAHGSSLLLGTDGIVNLMTTPTGTQVGGAELGTRFK
jgi:hypothetical protein